MGALTYNEPLAEEELVLEEVSVEILPEEVVEVEEIEE